MWELDYKENWAQKSWCFWTVVLNKTLESPLDCKELKPVNPQGNQSWICIGRTDAEAETPILWPPDAKNWTIGKHPDAGKDWNQEKGTTEGEMVGWHPWLDGHEFKEARGAGDGQGNLVCCSPWACRVGHDWTTELNCVFSFGFRLPVCNPLPTLEQGAWFFNPIHPPHSWNHTYVITRGLWSHPCLETITR